MKSETEVEGTYLEAGKRSCFRLDGGGGYAATVCFVCGNNVKATDRQVAQERWR